MDYRNLGRSVLKVSPLCFGGNVFGWTADEKTSFSLLDAWVDAGFNFIDTADVYSRWVPGHTGGESEAIIGSWLKKDPSKRDKVLIATKCGMVPAEGGLAYSAAFAAAAAASGGVAAGEDAAGSAAAGATAAGGAAGPGPAGALPIGTIPG